MKKTGVVANICEREFFVVSYDGAYAAFSSDYSVNLSVGDRITAELDKVGPMVMYDGARRGSFEAFSHSGQSCLISCLLLIEDLTAHLAAEERAFAMFYGETLPSPLEEQTLQATALDLCL